MKKTVTATDTNCTGTGSNGNAFTNTDASDCHHHRPQSAGRREPELFKFAVHPDRVLGSGSAFARAADPYPAEKAEIEIYEVKP